MTPAAFRSPSAIYVRTSVVGVDDQQVAAGTTLKLVRSGAADQPVVVRRAEQGNAETRDGRRRLHRVGKLCESIGQRVQKISLRMPGRPRSLLLKSGGRRHSLISIPLDCPRLARRMRSSDQALPRPRVPLPSRYLAAGERE